MQKAEVYVKLFAMSFATAVFVTKGFGATQPQRIWGVTIDNVSELSAITNSLAQLPIRPMARIVFDEDQEPGDYHKAVTEIHKHAEIMGELLDSQAFKAMSLEDYENRTQNFIAHFQRDVDVWEIGNEVNGEWLGKASDVRNKIFSAYRIARQARVKTALTLYLNDGCCKTKENAMFPWVEKEIPMEMKDGLDYVFVSFYDDDCKNAKPDWPAIFQKLGNIFPRARLGIGECGTTSRSKKAEYLRRYYNMQITHDRFIGGFFWWYFREDMVPASKPLLKALQELQLQNAPLKN